MKRRKKGWIFSLKRKFVKKSVCLKFDFFKNEWIDFISTDLNWLHLRRAHYPSLSFLDRTRSVCQANPATTRAFLWVRLAWRSIRNFQTPIWTSWPRWQVVDAARTARGRWRASRWDFRRPTRPWCVRVLLVCDRCFHRIHINDFERIWARLPVASLLSVLLVVVALFLIRKNKFIFNAIQ